MKQPQGASPFFSGLSHRSHLPVRHRRLAFKVAIILYLLAVLDTGINVCISGVVGWRASGLGD